MATKTKKPVAKKKPASKKAVSSKTSVRTANARRRPFITRSDEYTQLTWILISIWLVLIAIFLGSVIKQAA